MSLTSTAYKSKLPKSYANIPAAPASSTDASAPYYILEIAGLRAPIYLYKRRDTAPIIVRVEMIYITAGEPYFFRLIAKHRPFTSFVDARTVDNHVFTTYQEAAVALKLVEDFEDAMTCFKEAAQFNPDDEHDVHLTPARLRGLFVHLTLNGYPTVHIYNEKDLRATMLADWTQYANPRLSTKQVSTVVSFLTNLFQLANISCLAHVTHLTAHYCF
jgi:hypothetical protein